MIRIRIRIILFWIYKYGTISVTIIYKNKHDSRINPGMGNQDAVHRTWCLYKIIKIVVLFKGLATERTIKMIIFFNLYQNALYMALYFKFAHREHALKSISKHATTPYFLDKEINN